MWRGFFVSCRYSVSCWSESLRPNQVFHQNRNGIRQISQAVTKKRSFWVRDMPGFALADILEDISPQRHRVTEKNDLQLLYDIGVEYAVLLQIMRDGVLGEERRLELDFGTDPGALWVWSILRVVAKSAAAELGAELGALDLVELVDLAPGFVACRAGD